VTFVNGFIKPKKGGKMIDASEQLYQVYTDGKG
jgi:hypothetical protein